jgi:hypothetical protein
VVSTVFDIGSSGLKTATTQFIEINGNDIKFKGREFIAEPINQDSMHLYINSSGISAKSNSGSGLVTDGTFGFIKTDGSV